MRLSDMPHVLYKRTVMRVEVREFCRDGVYIEDGVSHVPLPVGDIMLDQVSHGPWGPTRTRLRLARSAALAHENVLPPLWDPVLEKIHGAMRFRGLQRRTKGGPVQLQVWACYPTVEGVK